MGIENGTLGACFWRSVGQEIHSDRWLYLAVAVYAGFVCSLLVLSGNSQLLSFPQYFPQWSISVGLLAPGVVLAGDLGWKAMRKVLARSPDCPLQPPNLARYVAGIALLQFMLLFKGAFTSFKNAMPVWKDGFHFDPLLADFDRRLHFDWDPIAFIFEWGLSHQAVELIEASYIHGWYLLIYLSLGFVAVSEYANRIRIRFVLMFMLTWVVCGNLIAYAFLSAGPVFFAKVVGDTSRFASISELLGSGDHGSLLTLHFQSYLWSHYESGTASLATCISAFPSVHVAAVTMLALFAWERNRLFGIVAACYVAFILFSSVALGWHYAVDGYASILVVFVMHHFVAMILARRRDAVPQFAVP